MKLFYILFGSYLFFTLHLYHTKQLKTITMKNSIKTTEVAREYFNETAVYLLETIAINSSNISCSSQARKMLESNDLRTIKRIACGQGSFMSACQRGDIMKAIRYADSENARALEGLVRQVIEKI